MTKKLMASTLMLTALMTVGQALAELPQGGKAGKQKQGKKNLVQVLKIKGDILKKEIAKKSPTTGKEITIKVYVLVDIEGNTIPLPMSNAIDLDDYVDKLVWVKAKGSVTEHQGKKVTRLGRIESIEIADVEFDEPPDEPQGEAEVDPRGEVEFESPVVTH